MLEKLKAFLNCFICFTLFACGQKESAESPENKIDVSLTAVLKWRGNLVDCANWSDGHQSWRINSLAFFMSNLLLTQGGVQTSIKSKAASSVTLVRFDTNSCKAKFAFTSQFPLQDGAVLSFELGVPFEINHLNPVTQPAPLNEPDMFWTWRNGYKFLRLDMRSQTDNWAWHLGSVGCVSASAVRSPQKQCAKPNLTRQKVRVPEGSISEGRALQLVVHLDRLLGEVEPKRVNRCVMHGEREPACKLLFKNLKTSNVFSLESI